MRSYNGGPGRSGSDSESGVHIAVVYAADGVRFLAARRSAEAVWRDVAEYVAANAGTKLWPGEAARVRGLLERGRRPRGSREDESTGSDAEEEESDGSRQSGDSG